MILDGLLLFSGTVGANNVLTGQAVNGAGSFVSTNTVDIAPATLGGNQPANIGSGTESFVAVSVITAPTVGTSVQFQVIQADDAALTTNVQVISQTDALPIASLPAGTIVYMRWGSTSPNTPKRYVGVRYVNTGAIATASYSAAVVLGIQETKNLYYKSGFKVS